MITKYLIKQVLKAHGLNRRIRNFMRQELHQEREGRDGDDGEE